MKAKYNVTETDNFHNTCCGCGACEDACPIHAITMQADSEGFYYPHISDACVSCGKCMQVCNLQKPHAEPQTERHLVWCYAKDEEIRKNSSSGGFFSELAKEIIAQGGAVYGAETNADLSVSHRCAETEAALIPLARSKYVQSRLKGCFSEIRSRLERGQTVLFVGTPCQVAAVKTLLGDNEDRLITVDFVCHGVPSAKIYEDMISYYEAKESKKAVNVTFREKDLGWRRQILKIYFDDGTTASQPSPDTFFFYSFLKNLSLRKSCYTCPYPEAHRSDITMADFWGAKTAEDKGISLLSINTEKGSALYETVKQRLVFGEAEETMDEYDTEKRAKFFSAYAKNGYDISQRGMKKIICKRKIALFKKRIRLFLSAIKRRLKKR